MLAWIDALPAGWFIRLALVRLAAQWRSVLTIIVGVLLAAVIGASVPLYTAAIAQVGMVQRLGQNAPTDVQIFSRSNLEGNIASGYTETWDALNTATNTRIADAFAPFGDWRVRTVNWGESTTLLPVRDDEDIPQARLRVAYYTDLDAEAELLEGAWPAEPTSDEIDLEIVLTDRVATALGLTISDRFVLDQRGRDSSVPINTQLVGIIRAGDVDSGYFAAPSPLRNDATSQWQVDANALTTAASFSRVNTEFVPETRSQIGWRVQLDHTVLDYTLSADAISAVNGLDNSLEAALVEVYGEEDAPTLVFTTELARVLDAYRGEVDQLNAPFSLLLLQLGALVLFFLVVMGALVRRGERREIAMLQSRGAPDRQIILLRGMETAIICAVTVVIAPWVARQLLIIVVPLLTDLDNLVLTVRSDSYGYAAVAAFVALIALTVTLIPMLRVPLVQAGGVGMRSGDQTWWQRYYLDVVVLIIGGAALWRLVSQDTVLAEDLAGDAQADPLLLLAPTLLVFALGSVLLRLFPLVMGILSRYFSGSRQAVEWTLSSWQVSRESLHYGRITFLLALAISIGWFAVSFQNTVVASQSDQAQYATGADLRLQYDSFEAATVPPVSAFMELDAVNDATVVTRVENVPMSLGLGLDEGTLLAVDSQQFPQVAYWRDDLGPLQVSEEIYQPPDTGVPIPADAQAITFDAELITVDGERSFATLEGEIGRQPQIIALGEIAVFAQVRDATNGLQLIPFTADRQDEFQQAVIDLAAEVAEEADQNAPTTLSSSVNLVPRADIIALGQEFYPDGLIPVSADISGLENATLESLTIEARHPLVQDSFNRFQESSSYLVIEQFESINADDERTPLDWATGEEWAFVPERNIDSAVQLIPEVTAPELDRENTLVIEWVQTRDSGTFRMSANPDFAALDPNTSGIDDAGDRVANALPALVSQSFIDANEVEVGQQFNLFLDQTEIWFDINGVIDYYPTLYNEEGLFLITESAAFNDRLSLLPQRTIRPNEVWLGVNGSTQDVLNGLGPEQNITDLTANFRIEAARAELETDPLAVGLIGLLFFSFLIGITLSVVSLVTYATLTVQARRTELSVLRAIGLSPGRITSSIAIEQSLVMLTAIVLGLIIGFVLSTQVLPALSTNTAGADVTPPFLIELELAALGQYIIVITLVLLTALAFSASLVRRLTNAQALRQVEV